MSTSKSAFHCGVTALALALMLAAAGTDRTRVLHVTAYLVGIDHWDAFNRVYADWFGDWRPTRTVVPVPNLHFGYLVEIDAIAAAGAA
jgi:enamine deaminase RidA (YjgF/YER057c/UK114 family)